MEPIKQKSNTAMSAIKFLINDSQMKLQILLALAFLVSFSSCSRESEKSLVALKTQIDVQQKQIDKLRNSNDFLLQRTNVLSDRCVELQQKVSSSSSMSSYTLNSRLQNIEARLDRDENVINRIGRRATNAYNQSSNPYNLR